MMVRVKVIPSSPRTEMVGTLADGTLKIRIPAAPERGKANAALIAFLAAKFGVTRQNVEIVSGHAAALKLVRIKK